MEQFERRQEFEQLRRRQEIVKRAIVGVILYRLLEQTTELKKSEDFKENPQDLFKEIADIFEKYSEEFKDVNLDEALQKVSEYFSDKEKLQEFLEDSKQNKKQILKDILQINIPK